MSSRPINVVYQDLPAPTATPDIPALNTVISGPCYVLKDYPDDAAEIELADVYGQLEADTTYVPPTLSDTALTVTAYPGNAAGALIDHASVRLVLKAPRVVVGSTYATGAPVLGTAVTTSATVGLENKVVFTGGTPDLVAAGVRAGDRIIINDSATKTYVGTVQSVGEPDAAGTVTNAAALRTTTNITGTGGVSGWTADASGECRIERQLATQAVVDDGSHLVFEEAGSDRLTVFGGLTIDVVLGTNTTATALPVSYAGCYLAYRALRQDLTTVDSLTSADIRTGSNGLITVGALGKYDARNPLAVGVYLALLNAGTAPIYYYGVTSNDSAGHLAARVATESRTDLWAFVPLTDDLDVIGSYKIEWAQIASPTYALENGVRQKFRAVLGNLKLPTTSTIADGSITGVASQPVTNLATGKFRTLRVDATSDIDVSTVLPGDLVTIGLTQSGGHWPTRRGTHKVAHVNKSNGDTAGSTYAELELVPGASAWYDSAGDSSGGIEVLIKSPTGAVKAARLATVSLLDASGKGVSYTSRVPTSAGGPYRVRYVAGAALAVALAGFDVTVTYVTGVTTTQNIVDLVNADAVIGALMTAELVSTSATVTADVPPTALTIDVVSRTFLDTGNGVKMTLRNPLTSPVYTVVFTTGATAGAEAVSIAGHDITVQIDVVGPASTMTQIAAAINAHATVGALIVATTVGTASASFSAGVAVQNIDQIDSTRCAGTVVTNDNLFVTLTDANATFLSNGVKIGDRLEIPIDAGNYLDSAFTGRVNAWTVAQVSSETSLQVQVLGDDSAVACNELPHYFSRDIAGRYIDNDTSGSPSAALRYRILRTLSDDEKVLQMIAAAQSLRDRRATVCFPDLVEALDLKDGSLPRTTPAVPAAAGPIPGWAVACVVGGALAGLPVHHGLTGFSFVGLTKLYHVNGYFRERQLAMLSDGGVFVMHQTSPGALPECFHQLTTDVTAAETGELSVVRNIDFVSLYFLALIAPFPGRWNAIPEALTAIYEAVQTGIRDLKNQTVAHLGAPLVSGTISSIAFSTADASRPELYLNGKVPRPLGGTNFHLVL